jgi:hypothetical protein
VQAILDRVVAQKVGWQPTIQVVAGLQNLFNPSFLSDPRLERAVPRGLIDWYQSKDGQWFHDELVSEIPPAPTGAAKSADARLYAGYGLLVARVERATGYLAKKHAHLLFGTDTPSAPIYSNPPGLNGSFEMQRLAEAGVTPAEIFQMATLSNAQALRLDNEIGTVQVGKRANLLLLRHDPTQTIEAYAGIAKVILRGRVIDPTELAATEGK